MKTTITKTADLALFALREDDFRQQVEQFAAHLGWIHYHTYRSKRSVPGFPDDVFVRERVVWVEFKTDTGKMSREQEAWRDALIAAGQEWKLWTPNSWHEIERVLAWPKTRQ